MDKRAQPPAHSRIEEGSRVQGQGAQGQGCTPYSFGLPCRDALDLLPRASSCCRKYDQLKFAYNGIRDGWLVRKARALFLRCIVLRRRNICSSLLHFLDLGNRYLASLSNTVFACPVWGPRDGQKFRRAEAPSPKHSY